ncbi:hypothetical protein ABZ725_26155 [Streptomyces sp. NPDC006872]|uniref:hypothetical protein n=1 Tax=Streptomyces sp. NPDC006872 TaxID=3155720 RepID=UPI0034080A06
MLTLSLISAPVVIVADRPASSIGVVIAGAFLVGIWIHRSISRSRASGDAAQARRRLAIISYAAAGTAGMLATLIAVPTTRSFIAHDLIGFSTPSEPVTIASLRTGETGGEESARESGLDEAKNGHVIELTVHNGGDTDELVKTVHLTVPSDYSTQCAASGDHSVTLDSEATVVRSKTAKRIDWIGTFEESDPGKRVDFDATLIAHCGGGSEVEFSIPVSVALPPRKFTRINLELPSEFQWSGGDYIGPWTVNIILPHGSAAADSGAADSGAAAHRIRVDLEITGDKVVVYRE